MKFIIVAFFLFGSFCLQQKPVMNFATNSNLPADEHTHSNESLALGELIEVVLTGHVNHVHEHNDHEEEASHSHPHEHTSPKLVSLFEFLPASFIFSLDNFKSPWPSDSLLNLAKSFQSEILRPPIS